MLSDCLKDELQFTTQQVLVEILIRYSYLNYEKTFLTYCRVYVAYGRKYISNQVSLRETLPKCIGEALRDSSRGPKHIVGEMR